MWLLLFEKRCSNNNSSPCRVRVTYLYCPLASLEFLIGKRNAGRKNKPCCRRSINPFAGRYINARSTLQVKAGPPNSSPNTTQQLESTVAIIKQHHHKPLPPSLPQSFVQRTILSLPLLPQKNIKRLQQLHVPPFIHSFILSSPHLTSPHLSSLQVLVLVQYPDSPGGGTPPRQFPVSHPADLLYDIIF